MAKTAATAGFRINFGIAKLRSLLRIRFIEEKWGNAGFLTFLTANSTEIIR